MLIKICGLKIVLHKNKAYQILWYNKQTTPGKKRKKNLRCLDGDYWKIKSDYGKVGYLHGPMV